MRSCLERICAYGNWAIGHVVLYTPGQTGGVAPTSLWECGDPVHYAEFMRYSDGFS